MKAKTIVLAGMAFALTLLSGCMEHNVFKGEKEEEKTFNAFDYSTVNPATTLEVAYLNTGVKARVYFELYDEMPVIENEYSYSKRPDVTPLFAAYTDKNGMFKENVQLPAYLKKVYIYTPAFYALTLIEAEVVNGSIKATDAVKEEAGTRTVTETEQEHDSYMVMPTENVPAEYKDKRWQSWLVEYDKTKNGEIKPSPVNDNLKIQDHASLYETHTKTIGNKHTDVCPDIYRRYTDLLVNEKAELAVTFFGQNTCWNCSLGYYYYKNGETPTSLNDMNVIMLFPNTQDGGWDQGQNSSNPNRYAKSSAGIDRGTVVQLKYYPDNDRTKGTTIFPAGLRIGFVLANNAWSNRIADYNSNKRYRAATSEGLSMDNNGNPYQQPRTAAFKCDNHVMISFEDHVDDQNFSDVVITMSSNPVKAIIDVPVVNPDDVTITTKILKGIYAFEDMWPAEGDYDMNDVVVRYDHEITFTKDNNNAIQSESFIFKTFQNYAAFANGLAFRVTPLGKVKSTKCYIKKTTDSEFSEANFTEETDGDEKVYLLTEDVRTNMGAEYKVTLEYESPITKNESAADKVDPFIYRASETTPGKRWEVHLPKTPPTSKMDAAFFDQEADASDLSQGIYYVRDGIYPFAIFLAGANEANVAKLLDRSNESKRIDELYPGYIDWVKNGGGTNADWYKQ